MQRERCFVWLGLVHAAVANCFWLAKARIILLHDWRKNREITSFYVDLQRLLRGRAKKGNEGRARHLRWAPIPPLRKNGLVCVPGDSVPPDEPGSPQQLACVRAAVRDALLEVKKIAAPSRRTADKGNETRELAKGIELDELQPTLSINTPDVN
ncbi:MAG: hypothetical protein RXS25_18875 [Paraburkholderia sp.]|uniref:hypothetical protein n=1 Tax=Paraburkholderia sp. TaxID=1926495 RepID=UPI0039782474